MAAMMVRSSLSAVKSFRVHCILDTGAMNVCIPEELCRQMGLAKIGTQGVLGANGRAEVPVYRAAVGISGLPDFEREVDILGLSTQTALLGYELFSQLDAIDISLKTGNVTFHAGEHSVRH